MKPLRIAIVGHIRHPICAPFKGGMEAFTWQLADGLLQRGHDVHLFASGDSGEGVPKGVHLHPIIDAHYDATYPWHDFHGTDVLNDVLDRAYSTACRALIEGEFDVVHNNSLHRYVPRLSVAQGVPMVTSLHIPPFDVLRRAVEDGLWAGQRMTVTSNRQMGIWWPETTPDEARVVHNGIDIDAWPYAPGGDGSAVWSGRITPTKGTHLAAQAALIADVPLRIFGVIEHADYFETEVRPLLSDKIAYCGHIEADRLAQEYATASAFLFTPQWEEPFGLVAAEAMATGLPVAAIDQGAAREVLGPTGCISRTNNAEGLADALMAALLLSPDAARRRAETHFGRARMIDRFEACYDEVIRGARVPHLRRVFASHQMDVAPQATRAAAAPASNTRRTLPHVGNANSNHPIPIT